MSQLRNPQQTFDKTPQSVDLRQTKYLWLLGVVCAFKYQIFYDKKLINISERNINKVIKGFVNLFTYSTYSKLFLFSILFLSLVF